MADQNSKQSAVGNKCQRHKQLSTGTQGVRRFSKQTADFTTSCLAIFQNIEKYCVLCYELRLKSPFKLPNILLEWQRIKIPNIMWINFSSNLNWGRKENGTTLLHNAAYQGHLKICQHTIKIWRIRTPNITMEQLHFIMLPIKVNSKFTKILQKCGG